MTRDALRPTATLDVTRKGGPEYKRAELQEVTAYISGLQASGGTITEGDIALATGIGGRTIRAILFDLDGILFLLGTGADGGLIVCQYADEGDSKTIGLDRSWRTTRERVARRKQFSLTLPRRQVTLFPDAEIPWRDE
jgi:hypothetical protein